MTQKDTLSVKQSKLIDALLQSCNVKQACKTAKVSRKSYYRWMDDKRFTDALESAKKALLERESIALMAGMESCRTVLYKLAVSAESENQQRMSALALYEMALKVRESIEIESRIEEIERFINDQQK